MADELDVFVVEGLTLKVALSKRSASLTSTSDRVAAHNAADRLCADLPSQEGELNALLATMASDAAEPVSETLKDLRVRQCAELTAVRRLALRAINRNDLRAARVASHAVRAITIIHRSERRGG